MKKLVLALAVAFSMTMFACSNNAEKAEAEEAPATEEVAAPVAEAAEEVADSCCDSTTVVEAEVVEAAPVAAE